VRKDALALASATILKYHEIMEPQISSNEIPNRVLSTEHIVATPGTCGGKPRIAGHRIRVQDVAIWHERLGYTIEEIIAHYPQLTLAEVHAALAYYYDHRDEIQHDIEEAEAFVERMKRETPSKLREKLSQRDAGTDTLPPG
jgi:uncharacterized protein (DUF433 family)